MFSEETQLTMLPRKASWNSWSLTVRSFCFQTQNITRPTNNSPHLRTSATITDKEKGQKARWTKEMRQEIIKNNAQTASALQYRRNPATSTTQNKTFRSRRARQQCSNASAEAGLGLRHRGFPHSSGTWAGTSRSSEVPHRRRRTTVFFLFLFFFSLLARTPNFVFSFHLYVQMSAKSVCVFAGFARGGVQY